MLKREIIEVSKLIAQKGFVSATDGNLSIRISKNKIICTPTSKPKSKLDINDLVTIDESGRIIEGINKPSSEIKMHLEIYSLRNDVNAIVHAHPIYATGFATSKIAIDTCVFPEVILGLGAVPVCKYATPSTEEVVNSMRDFINKTNVLLLQNHGAVTYGKDIWDAYYKMEKLEHSAHTLFVSKMLGGENILGTDDISKLLEVNKNKYKIELSNKMQCKTIDNIFTDKSNEEINIQNLVKEIINELKRRG